ncbi:MAG: STAS domain-containing protein [Bacteroidota bacterium]|nr:STAS domain-containing protein [Bacteroidota bacterium]
MSDFTVGIRHIDTVTVLDLKGQLDAHTAPDLEQVIADNIGKQRYRLVVNFRDLSYISSAGLGVFMQFIEDVRKHGGDIKLTNMSPRVYDIFDLLGFPMLYEIFPEESHAVERFRTTPPPADMTDRTH